MTMDQLFANVDNAIYQYQQACQQEEDLAEMMQDAERGYYRYSSQMTSSEDPNVRNAAADRVAQAQKLYFQYQTQLQQAQYVKAQQQRVLQGAKMGIEEAMQDLTNKIGAYNQSIGTLEQMTALPFGGNSASQQLVYQKQKRQEYQQNLNDLGTLFDRIESALNGAGDSKRLVLRR